MLEVRVGIVRGIPHRNVVVATRVVNIRHSRAWGQSARKGDEHGNSASSVHAQKAWSILGFALLMAVVFLVRANKNVANGFSIPGLHSTLTRNRAERNSGDGFNVSSGIGNRLGTNTTSRNTGDEFHVVAGNIDLGGNKANGASCPLLVSVPSWNTGLRTSKGRGTPPCVSC
jgi:hypothetical protein